VKNVCIPPVSECNPSMVVDIEHSAKKRSQRRNRKIDGVLVYCIDKLK